VVIYGINPVLEALKSGRVRAIRVADRSDERLSKLLDEAAARGVTVHRVAKDVLESESRRGVHQGVVADVEQMPESTLDDLMVTGEHAALIVVLDEVEDPQNVGAIIRTVDAAGATGVVRQTRRAAPLDGAAGKASAGAVHHVRIATVVNIARSLEELKRAGIWTLGLDAEADAPYFDWDFTLPTAIVVGAEGHGLRRLVKERCDQVVSIPMHGHVGSLNVSAATAIVLYEAVRQRRSRERSETTRR
jgi:23S rRNA (guanosine2251-2'-O)-methyltransferase